MIITYTIVYEKGIMIIRESEAIVYSFDNVDEVYKMYIENVSELHEYMKRQWGFVAQMAVPFVDMMAGKKHSDA